MFFWIQGLEEVHLAGRERGYRKPVAIEQPITGQRRQPRTRRDDAEQIEGIRARQRHVLAGRRPAARFAQRRDRLGSRELLARESGNEPSPPMSPKERAAEAQRAQGTLPFKK